MARGDRIKMSKIVGRNAHITIDFGDMVLSGEAMGVSISYENVGGYLDTQDDLLFKSQGPTIWTAAFQGVGALEMSREEFARAWRDHQVRDEWACAWCDAANPIEKRVCEKCGGHRSVLYDL